MDGTWPRDQPDLDPVLTPIQHRIIGAIAELTGRKGHGPSYREIGQAVGRGVSSVARQVSILENKGMVNRDPRRPRTVVVAGRGGQQAGPELIIGDCPEMASVPLVGQIPAGGPNVAEEAIEDTVTLPSQFVGNGPLIMLKVVGDSMTGAAIRDGDLAVVRQQRDAQNGEIVAALIDGEATVKTFRRSEGHVWLMPHNPLFEPIPGDEAEITGKVVLLMRRI